ncbi:MAG: T9SS type A sorting domain-containing protein [bacterium]
MKLFSNSNKIKVGILLLLALGMCVGLRAETQYAPNEKETKLMSLLENRLLKPFRNSTVDMPQRNGNQIQAEVSGKPRTALDTIWVREYRGPGGGDCYPWPHAIAVDDSGNVYMAGASYGIGTQRDYTTIKYDREGNEIWVARYDLYGGEDVVRAMTIDDSGNVYVTGISGYLMSSTLTTIKYDSNGDTVWVRQHTGSGGFLNYGSALVVDDSGNAYVTGFETGVSLDGNCVTLKYNKEGSLIWCAIYDTPGTDMDLAEGMDIALDNAGNIYVGGHYTPDLGVTDYMTIKYSPDGETLWCQIWDGGDNDWDYGEHIVADDSGNSYITGAANFYETTTLKYDTNGNLQWVNPGTSYYPLDLTRDASGNILVTSYSNTYNGSPWVTIKYNPAGDCVWWRSYSDGKRPWDMTVDSSGNLYVAGSGIGPVCEDEYHTVKYDSSGNQLWVVTYNGYGWYNCAFGVALDDSGYVYVTGEVDENYGGSGSITTIKYRQLPIGVAEQQAVNTGANGFRVVNPVRDNIIVYVPNNINGYTSLSLYNVSGRLVKNLNADLTKTERQINIPANELSNGIYFLRIHTAKEDQVLKVVKVR